LYLDSWILKIGSPKIGSPKIGSPNIGSPKIELQWPKIQIRISEGPLNSRYPAPGAIKAEEKLKQMRRFKKGNGAKIRVQIVGEGRGQKREGEGKERRGERIPVVLVLVDSD
jgi:hypothetical protein